MTINQAPPLPTEQYMRNCRWIGEHIKELVRTYGNGWIAVDRERVLAAGPGLDEVTRKAAKSGAPPNEVVYEFIDDGTIIPTAL